MELNQSSYTVSEDDGALSVCASVTAAYDYVACPMEFYAYLAISTRSRQGSAGDDILS